MRWWLQYICEFKVNPGCRFLNININRDQTGRQVYRHRIAGDMFMAEQNTTRRKAVVKKYNRKEYIRKEYYRHDYNRKEYSRKEYSRKEYSRKEYSRKEYRRMEYYRK